MSTTSSSIRDMLLSSRKHHGTHESQHLIAKKSSSPCPEKGKECTSQLSNAQCLKRHVLPSQANVRKKDPAVTGKLQKEDSSSSQARAEPPP